MTDFSIGKQVWFQDAWGNINSGTIKSGILKTSTPKSADYIFIHWDEGGTSGELCRDLYETKEALLAAINEHSNEKKIEYRSQVKSKDDLIRFCFRKATSGEDPDYEAIEVAKEKAKEFDIDLDLE